MRMRANSIFPRLKPRVLRRYPLTHAKQRSARLLVSLHYTIGLHSWTLRYSVLELLKSSFLFRPCSVVPFPQAEEERRLSVLMNFLREKRGKQQVNSLGDALGKYFQSGEAVRRDGENLVDYELSHAALLQDMTKALREVGSTSAVPPEIFGWFALNQFVRMDPSDVATVKSHAASYKFEDVMTAMRKVWGGESLAEKDGERKRRYGGAKTYMAMPSAKDPDEDAVWANYVPGEARLRWMSLWMTWGRSLTAPLCMWPIGPAEGSIQSKVVARWDRRASLAAACAVARSGIRPWVASPNAALMAALVPALAALVLCTPSSQSQRRPQRPGADAQPHSGSEAAPEKALAPKTMLHSGASESIVRTNTLQQIYDQLRDMGFDADQEVKVDRSINMSFVFGNDQTRSALGLAKVNAGICGLEKPLGVHVVDGSTPLLLSGKWLYDAGAVIDFRTGRAKFREVSDREVQLERAPSYRLMMPVTAFGGNEEALRELFVPDESDEGPSQIFQTGPGPGKMRSP